MLRFIRMLINMFCCYFILSLPAIAATDTAFSPEGRYTFYCDRASSQAKIVSCYGGCAVFYKYFLGDALKGESVMYPSGKTAQDLIETYSAEVLFTEEAGGVVNYYCYTETLPYSTELYDRKLNLHIAVNEQGSVSVGTPLIFGGF